MFDITVQLYKSKQLVNTNLLEHIKNKKVIFCPNLKIYQKPTIIYLKYLNGLLDTHGVDEIILINSSQDKFFHTIVESYFPRITTLTDESQTFIKSLKDSKNRKENIDNLAQTWIFQQLVCNCQEIGFWEQPLLDNWEHLLANKQAMKELMKFGSYQRKILQKLYKFRHTNNLWNVGNHNIMTYTQENDEGSTLSLQMGANFWYYNLFHNKKLESALYQISNSSTNINNRSTNNTN
jgi:hypothetical protein